MAGCGWSWVVALFSNASIFDNFREILKDKIKTAERFQVCLINETGQLCQKINLDSDCSDVDTTLWEGEKNKNHH